MLVPDVAAVLRLSQNAVRDLMARGEIPAAKVGRQWVVRRAGLLAHLRVAERRRRRDDPTTMPTRTVSCDIARIALAARE